MTASYRFLSSLLLATGICLILPNCQSASQVEISTYSSESPTGSRKDSSPGTGDGPVRLSALFEIPPVFKRLAGDPLVRFKKKPGVSLMKTTFQAGMFPLIAAQGDPWTSIECTYPSLLGKSQRDRLLATAVCRNFYTSFADSKVGKGLEFGRMNRQRFIRTGALRLRRKTVRDRVADAWWDVRMGVISEDDPAAYRSGYVMFVTDNFASFEPLGIGHSSICLRKIGGDPDKDFVLDPRAPTYPEYQMSFSNVVFGDPRLINGLQVYSLWDWMEVQTLDRFVDIHSQIFAITESQAILLLDYARSDLRYRTGMFHFFGNNCARLATELLDAILPLDQKLERGLSPVSLPAEVREKSSERFPLIADIVFRGRKAPEGLVFPPNMKMRRLKSRAKSPQFQNYLRFEKANSELFAPYRKPGEGPDRSPFPNRNL